MLIYVAEFFIPNCVVFINCPNVVFCALNLFENDFCISGLLNSNPMCAFMIGWKTDSIFLKDIGPKMKIKC